MSDKKETSWGVLQKGPIFSLQPGWGFWAGSNKMDEEAQPPPSCCLQPSRLAAGMVFPLCCINPTPNQNNCSSLFNFTLSVQSTFTSLFIPSPISQLERTDLGLAVQLL